MILDSIDHFDNYINLHPLFPKVSEYLKQIDFDNLQTGTFGIMENDLFAIISNSSLNPKDKTKLESHNQYIDIQIPVSKTEQFGWSALNNLNQPIGTYDLAKDILFYQDTPSNYIHVAPRHFIIFYPQDAHAPCIGEGNITKIVIKIKIKPSV